MAMHTWFSGRVPGCWVEIRTEQPDLNLRQVRQLLKLLRMIEGWLTEDELRAGPEDSCVGRDELP